MIRLVFALVAALPVVPSALHASHVCSTSRTRSGLDPGTPLTGGSALEFDSSLAPASAYSHDAAAATPLRIADLQLRLIDFAVRRSQIVCASQLVRIATGTVYGTMSTGTCRDRAG